MTGAWKNCSDIALLLNEKQEGAAPSLIIVPRHYCLTGRGGNVPELSLFYCGREQYLGVMHMADAVLTTYGTILRDIEKLKEKNFHYIILDEAQAIKNPTSDISRVVKELQGSYRLALSGTPIENNLAELWSLFSFLNPGILGTLRSFAENFIRPIDKDQNEYAADSLRKLIFPFILRRTKEQVAKELPPKNDRYLYGDAPDKDTL